MEAVTPMSAAFIASFTSAKVSEPFSIVTLPPVTSLLTVKLPLDQLPNSNVNVPEPTLADSDVNPSNTSV